MNSEQKLEDTKIISQWELFRIFLKLGSIAFGGYMAMVAMIERELAERRKLIKHEDVLDSVALATALPGPVAVNVVAYLGFKLRGLTGALVSMLAVIIPSFLLMVFLAEFYARFGEIKDIANLFRGFLPAVVAIIVSVAWRMGKQSIKSPMHWAILLLVATFFLAFGGFTTAIGMIVVSALIGILFFKKSDSCLAFGEQCTRFNSVKGAVVLSLVFLLTILVANFFYAKSTLNLLLTNFSSMSLMMFGGGYVFIPMIKEVVVQQHAWLSSKEFADAIALGQVTPGPIMISATFIGYRVAGLVGAIVATVAIFLPAALLIIVFSGLHQKVNNSSIVKAAYQGIRPCIVALIFSASVVLAKTTDIGLVTIVIFLLSLVGTIQFKLDTVYVVPLAGVLGVLGYGYI